MKINNKEYPVIGIVKSVVLGEKEVPVLDMPMISDERWMELVNEQKQQRKVVQ